MIKMVLLQIMLNDTQERYKKYHKGRVSFVNWLFRFFQFIIYTLMLFRYLNNCYSDKINNIFNFPSQAQYGLYTGLKIVFLVAITIAFFNMKDNKYLFIYSKFLKGYLCIFCCFTLFECVHFILLEGDVVKSLTTSYEGFFLVDISLIMILTLALLY